MQQVQSIHATRYISRQNKIQTPVCPNVHSNKHASEHKYNSLTIS